MMKLDHSRFDKNGADGLKSVICYICGNPSKVDRSIYHSSTQHWRYQCKKRHAWWIGLEEIEKNAI